MNQDKLDVVKQEMAGENIDILGISKLTWTGMGKFNSDDHYIYYYGQGSLSRNGVALRFSSVQSLSHVRLFLTPWIAACQASLSVTNSRSLLKLMFINLMMPSSHLIFCCSLLLLPPIPPIIKIFPVSQLFAWGGQTIGISVSASVLPMNTQDWFPLEWIDWISLQSKRLSRVFSITRVEKHQFFSAQLSSQPNSHIHRWPLEKP